VTAARVVPPRARREWCVELEVAGLMSAEEVRTYACESEAARRAWAEHARSAAKTPSGIGIQSALGQTGQSITRELGIRLGNWKLQVGLYTILPLPILYSMYCNKGWSGEPVLILVQWPRVKRIFCKCQAAGQLHPLLYMRVYTHIDTFLGIRLGNWKLQLSFTPFYIYMHILI